MSTPTFKDHAEYLIDYVKNGTGTAAPGTTNRGTLVEQKARDVSANAESQFGYTGGNLTTPRATGGVSVRGHVDAHKAIGEELDFARRRGDKDAIAALEKKLNESRETLSNVSTDYAVHAGDALHGHVTAHEQLVAQQKARLEALEKVRLEQASHIHGNTSLAPDARKAAIDELTARHNHAVQQVTEEFKPLIDGHANTIGEIQSDMSSLAEHTGKSFETQLGKNGSSALAKAEKITGNKLGTAVEAGAAAETKTLMGRLGGVKQGVIQNWKTPGFLGKAKVVVGGLMVADGVRRVVSDVGGMMGGDKGLDKNGEPLPSPGIMNLAFDIGEAGLGAVVASTQMFTKGR